MTFIIYKIRHCNYIGSTSNMVKRKSKHKQCLNKKYMHNYNLPIYKYLREHDIKIELIPLAVYNRKCSKKIRNVVEQYWINKFDSIENGLNTIKSFTTKEQTKEKQKQQRKEYREKNKEKLKKYKKEYRKKNKDELNRKNKIYYEETKEERLEYQKEYRKKNKELIKEKMNKNKKKYNKNRMVKIECPICKCLTTKSNLKRHQKSKRCKSFI